MLRPAWRVAAIAAFALVLSGCGGTNLSDTWVRLSGAGLARPSVVLVGGFEPGPGLVPEPGGPRARKMGPRQAEVIAQVSRTFSDTMVEALRNGGLPATAGGPELATSGEPALLAGGLVRNADQADPARRKVAALGSRRGMIVADVRVTHQTASGRNEVLSFTAEAGPAPAGAPRQAATIEAQARRAGEAAASRILAWAAEQGWVKKPGT